MRQLKKYGEHTFHSGIYVITNTLTGQLYIGMSAVSMLKRWHYHRFCARNNKPTSPLHEDMIRYGMDKFTYREVIRTDNMGELETLEGKLIAFFGTTNPANGYNVCALGQKEWSARGKQNARTSRLAYLAKTKQNSIEKSVI